MPGFTRITINEAAIRDFVTSPAGPIYRAVDTATRRTANSARIEAPADTGHLRSSIQDQVFVQGLRVVGRVWTPLAYGLYQHQGTGVYAGRGPIRPRNGQYLVFKPKNMGPVRAGGGSSRHGGYVFAKQVKGVPPNPFLLRALEANSPWPVRRLM